MKKIIVFLVLMMGANCLYASNWSAISAGSYHTMATKTDGTLWALGGYNGAGALGLGDQIDRNTPIQVGSDTNWLALFAGGDHTIAIKTDGTLWAWGYNTAGQLGLGDSTTRLTPTQVGSGWVSVSTHIYHTIATMTNGTLWAWGYNSDGQLGLGDSTNRFAPTQVGSDTNWLALFAGPNHTMATKTDGTLWGWGNNLYFKINSVGILNNYTPTQVDSDTNWLSVSGGSEHTFAIKTDGTLWGWGRNWYGELGLGNTTNTQTMRQVGVDTNWATVSGGFQYTVAIKMDGTLWSSGDNDYGQLGLGDTTPRNIFTQIGSDTNWLSVSIGKYHNAAIKTDGTIWVWGENSDSQLGLGDTVDRLIPTQVNLSPNLSWTSEVNYISDGLNPESGDRNTSFIFRVKYTDSDDDAPANGYPKVHIKKGGVEISGSPFAMTETDAGDTVYSDGKLYSLSKTLVPGSDYTYYFEAQDVYSGIATGTPTSEVDAPDVSNNVPTLDWTGEVNYVSDGLNPETGLHTESFVFRVKYTDSDNDAPASLYPKVHIKKGGTEISGSPFVMTEVSAGDTVYSDGKLYSLSKILVPGSDYTYYFEAQDIYSGIATGTPLNPLDAPDVSNNVPALSWTGEANYISDGLNPETGQSPLGLIFRIKYSDSDNDASASGYPKLHIKKGGAEISGSPFAMTETDGGDTTYTDGKLYSYSKTLSIGGDYVYYFEARDIYGAIATGTPLTEKSGLVVIGTGAPIPETNTVKVYHGVFKPGENEKTNVSFSLSAPGLATVEVYDSAGRKIKDLYRGISTSGLNTIQWNGTDSGGSRVSSGVYTIKIKAPGINQTKRVVVIR